MSDAGALLFAKVVQAQIELEAMKIANQERARNDFAFAYGEDAFRRVWDELDAAVVHARNLPGFLSS